VTQTAVPQTRTTVQPPRRQARLTWRQVVLPPLVLAVVVGLTLWWITTRDLDALERNALVPAQVWAAFLQQVKLTVISTALVLAIAVPLGVVLTRRGTRFAAPVVTAIAGIGQATPAIGLLVLLALWLGLGDVPAVVGMVVYAALPVLSNTMAGLRAVDPLLVEAGKGVGMSARQVLARIELPLAVPLILAGARTTLVLNVGTATLATFVDAGGLGQIIQAGILLQRPRVLLFGSILTVVLALLVDWIGSLAERLLRPRGVETEAS
jgi:osmoprotectant transport system permease protein